jgi:hypothetical protein
MVATIEWLGVYPDANVRKESEEHSYDLSPDAQDAPDERS